MTIVRWGEDISDSITIVGDTNMTFLTSLLPTARIVRSSFSDVLLQCVLRVFSCCRQTVSSLILAAVL